MRQARLQPCRTKRQARLTMQTALTIRYNNKRNEAQFYVDDIYIFHFSGCLYTAIRGDKVSFQSSHPDSNRSFTNNCRLRWNSFTLLWLIISSGIRLYIHISPKALRRSISRKCLSLMSAIYIPCLILPLRVLGLCCVDAAKKVLKWSGPFLSMHRCISPSMAMSRLHGSGARLK